MGRVKAKFESSVFDVLMVEHRDVDVLFDQIQAVHAESAEEARDLFTVLADSLLAHARAEQSVLYARLSEIKELEPLMEEAKAEHEAVEMLINELQTPAMDSVMWLARLGVLQENVKHHVQEEEMTVFPKARDHLGDAEQKQLAASYLQAKSRRSGEPETELARGRVAPKKSLKSRLAGLFR
jgi:hemerythrin superfamily protein